jgi:acyl-coenzyme A thioesterase 13
MDKELNSSIQTFINNQLGVENPIGLSPFGNWLGGKLISFDNGKLIKEYGIRYEMTNAIGTLHGGVIASMLDEIIGATVISMGFSTFKTTINLVVDYFYPVYEGQTILATARILKEGQKITHLEGELYFRDSNKLIARAITNMFTTEIPVDLSKLNILKSSS